MNEYNGKIYKISNNTNEICYIGSTNFNIKYRLSHHISDYKRWKKGLCAYYTCFKLFDTYGLENINIELVEDNIAGEDLLTKEAYYINLFNCCNKSNNRRITYLDSLD